MAFLFALGTFRDVSPRQFASQTGPEFRVTRSPRTAHLSSFALQNIALRCTQGNLFIFIYGLSFFLTITAFVSTNAKYGIPLSRYTVFLKTVLKSNTLKTWIFLFIFILRLFKLFQNELEKILGGRISFALKTCSFRCSLCCNSCFRRRFFFE